MEGLWILLGLIALAWICIGPILFFVQASRISRLSEQLQRMRRDLDKLKGAGHERHAPVSGIASPVPLAEPLAHPARPSPQFASAAAAPEAAITFLQPPGDAVPPVSSVETPTTASQPAHDMAALLRQRVELRQSVAPSPSDVPELEPIPAGDVNLSGEFAPIEKPVLEGASAWEDEAVGSSLFADSPVPKSKKHTSALLPQEPSWFNEMDASQWLTWIGALAVMIGAGLGLKYAIENQYLGETGRVALGILSGVATFVGAAYAMKKDYRVLAEGLAGAAMGILYFSLFAGFQWYELMPQSVAFGGMIVVTAVGLSFAGVFNSLPAAVLAMIGGFLTPYMLSKGGGHVTTLFTYILILDLGVLALATFRSWGQLHLLNFGGTLIIWMGWLANGYRPEELWLTVAWITLFAVVFSLMGLWRHVIRKETSSTPDMALMLLTPIAYFAALYGLTKAEYSNWHGIMALLVAAYYLGLGCSRSSAIRGTTRSWSHWSGSGCRL